MITVRLDIQDKIAVVTLDHPPVNALSREVLAEITETFDSLHDRPDANVAILTGAGDRAFCAGADIKAMLGGASGAPMANDHGRSARSALDSIYECAIPVIGAINGPALGGGLALVASCDFAIASERATFALPEIDMGLLGGARHMAQMFPMNVVRRMHYTADRMSAEEAHRWGAVLRVVPHDRLMEEALREAALIAAKMPMALRLAKESLNMLEWMDVKNGYRFEQTRTAILSRSEDAQEARQAFLEKRSPAFRGR